MVGQDDAHWTITAKDGRAFRAVMATVALHRWPFPVTQIPATEQSGCAIRDLLL
jgi:hypothetical protein